MQKPEHIPHKRHHKKLEELNLIDNFLFQEMLSHEDTGEEFGRILLSTILGKNIRKVRIIPQKSILGVDTDRHGIRLDAYIEDVSDEPLMTGTELLDAQITPDIYDVEPNNTYEKASLPKRMRYYQGLIDSKVLSSGINYESLQNVIIIMILPYDPFDRDRMVYTVKNHCIEDASIPYEDEATKIFLYTRGTKGTPSQELKDMLQYIEETTVYNVTNQDIETINNLVNKVKQSKEVGINYMKSWEIEKKIADDARKEGVKQGVAQGVKQGIEQSFQAFLDLCRDFHLSKDESITKASQKFDLPAETIEKYVNKYW